MSQPIEITLKGIQPDEDLIYATRRFCQLIGSSVGDQCEWRVLIERTKQPSEAPFRSRVEVRTEHGRLDATGLGADPQVAAQLGLASLLGYGRSAS